MQEVQLDSKVKLLDSPGLVMAGGNRNDASVALRNAVKVQFSDSSVLSQKYFNIVKRKNFCLLVKYSFFINYIIFLRLVLQK